jgi:hypothetical protein
MMASSLSVLSGSAETAACKYSTTSNRFWLICVFDTGSRGEWNGEWSGGGRDGILSIVVI